MSATGTKARPKDEQKSDLFSCFRFSLEGMTVLTSSVAPSCAIRTTSAGESEEALNLTEEMK